LIGHLPLHCKISSNQSQFGKSGGDLVYEGRLSIIESVLTATADQQASQNRLKIRVNVRFTNRNKEIDNFERTFEFFFDYPANQQLSGATLNSAIKVILKELHKIYLMNLLRNGNHTC
jgi:hypothetical protein